MGLKEVESGASNCMVMDGLAQKSRKLDFYPTSASKQLVGLRRETSVK